MSNFIPNELKKRIPGDYPSMNADLKRLLRKTDKHYRNYKKHWYRGKDKETREALRDEYKESIEAAKKLYL